MASKSSSSSSSSLSSSSSSSPFSTRTLVEYFAILVAIFFFFGNQLLDAFQGQQQGEGEGSVPASQADLSSLVYPDPQLECSSHPVDVHIFSRSPLIVYIPSFLTDKEAHHMIDSSESKWTPSTVFNNGVESSDPSVRKSDKAMIDRDEVVQCIEQRALDVQGWPEDTFIERIWTQRYTESGHYAHHYDWSSASKSARRVSTFMVYVQANCTGGGTNFPLLTRPKDSRWCQWIDCNEPVENGVTFLPKAGSAVYWENFDADGNGWREGLHAGMPVTSGVKVGLNIWSWYQRGHKPSAEKSEE